MREFSLVIPARSSLKSSVGSPAAERTCSSGITSQPCTLKIEAIASFAAASLGSQRGGCGGGGGGGGGGGVGGRNGSTHPREDVGTRAGGGSRTEEAEGFGRGDADDRLGAAEDREGAIAVLGAW